MGKYIGMFTRAGAAGLAVFWTVLGLDALFLLFRSPGKL